MDKPTAYVKLSRIRDYGIGEYSDGLPIEKLDTFTNQQLINLRDIFIEEIGDIDYQLKREEKHYDHDLKWHYGAKSSKKARQTFIDRINEIVNEKIAGSINEKEDLLNSISEMRNFILILQKEYPDIYYKISNTFIKPKGFSAKDLD